MASAASQTGLRQRRLLPLLLLLLCLSRLPQSAASASSDGGGGGGGGGGGERKPLSAYTEADLERLEKQWQESDPDDEPEAPRTWKSPQLDLTKVADLSDPTLILQHSNRGQPILLSVRVAGDPDRASLETLSHRWQLEMFNAHMETTRRVHEDGRVLLVALDGSQVARVRDYLVAQPLCHSVTVEGHTVLGRGAPVGEAATGAGQGKTEL